MKVKTLRKLLEQYPDDAEVVVPYSGGLCRKVHEVGEAAAVFTNSTDKSGSFIFFVPDREDLETYVVRLGLGTVKVKKAHGGRRPGPFAYDARNK